MKPSTVPQFGFRLRTTSRGVDLEVYGAPAAASLVSSFVHERHVVAVLGRIHYRHDVPIGSGVRFSCAQNDAALALAAYLSGGAEALAGLEGEFSLALWDGERLVGRRDPLGGYPLFWTTTAAGAAFATGLGPLLELLPRQALDVDHLAGFLLSGTAAEPSTESCVYQGIQRVVPNTLVTLEGGRTRRWVYWDWLSEMVDPGTGDIEEIARRYRHTLTEAVRQRMDGVTACQLSGGMDSTSICLLALELLRSGVGTPPLHALSLVYEQLPHLAKERPYIDAVLRQGASDVAAHLIDADDLLDFDSFCDPPPHDEPFMGLSAMTTERVLVETAAACGASLMLTGRGGDDLLVVEPCHIADLIRRGQLVGAWREACRFALARGSNAGRIMRRQMTTLAPGWRHGPPGRRAGLRQLDDGSVPPWVSPAFARRHDLGRRARESLPGVRRRDLPAALSMALFQLEHRVGDAYRWTLAAPLGISMSHPFLDTRVIRVALGALTVLTPTPQPMKPLLAEAMRGSLPEEIRTRPAKRSFNEVYYLGLRRNLGALRKLIQDAPAETVGIDGAVLAQYLDDAAMGIADPRQSFGVDTSLALLQWLSKASSEPEHSHLVGVGRAS